MLQVVIIFIGILTVLLIVLVWTIARANSLSSRSDGREQEEFIRKYNTDTDGSQKKKYGKFRKKLKQ